MSTFTKEQLMNMEEVNLHALAQALEISNYSAKDRDELVYDILDQQAIITASEMSNKPKRGRKKKEVEKTTDDTETNTPAELAEPNAEEVVAPKKKRGRPKGSSWQQSAEKIVRAVDEDGKSFSQIGREMGCSYKTISTIYNRAKENEL